jgi:heat-inducible transcriptional repressor
MNQTEHLPALTRRQEELLAMIVRAYSENPEPISSKYIAEQPGVNYSSATVRNEMAHLEELGYLTSPHTSSGRIPTTQGFRYFVRGLIEQATLGDVEQEIVTQKLNAAPNALDEWMRQAATLLARKSSGASIVTSPSIEQSRFKHIELINIQGRLTLMVLVLQGGVVHQRMLNLAEPIAQTRLSELANHLNRICADLNAAQLMLKARQMSELEREIAEIAAEVMQRSDSQPVHTVYQDGLSDIIKSFPDQEAAQQAVRIYEEPAFLDLLVREVLDPNNPQGVQVIIAGDGRYEELNQLSIVISRYGERRGLSGALGVFGPTHLNYSRAISAVRFIASKITDKLADLTERSASSANSENDE